MIKVGDIVNTTKGCRFKRCYDDLKVLKVGLKWGDFQGVLCEKEDGSKRLFLVKNLVKKKG